MLSSLYKIIEPRPWDNDCDTKTVRPRPKGQEQQAKESPFSTMRSGPWDHGIKTMRPRQGDQYQRMKNQEILHSMALKRYPIKNTGGFWHLRKVQICLTIIFCHKGTLRSPPCLEPWVGSPLALAVRGKADEPRQWEVCIHIRSSKKTKI